MAGGEEARGDMLDKLTSGSGTERLEGADSTRSRSRSKLDIGGSLGVGEKEVEQMQGVELPAKQVRSAIRALGQVRREIPKEIAEGKNGKAPDKPEIVAGKKRSFKETKTKGRSTFSAITSSEGEGTEYEYGGSAKKKQRLALVVGVNDDDDDDDDETEDDDLGRCSA